LCRVVQLPELIVHAYHVALGARARCQHARFERGNLDRDLVGLELDDRLAGRDRLAFLLQPPRDSGLGNGFAEWGNLDRDHART
jgi:hypothetical protein